MLPTKVNYKISLSLVVNRILFRFGFGRKFRPKHVSVSAFRLSPVSVIRPKHFFRPKGAVSAKMTILDKRVHIVILYRCWKICFLPQVKWYIHLKYMYKFKIVKDYSERSLAETEYLAKTMYFGRNKCFGRSFGFGRSFDFSQALVSVSASFGFGLFWLTTSFKSFHWRRDLQFGKIVGPINSLSAKCLPTTSFHKTSLAPGPSFFRFQSSR